MQLEQHTLGGAVVGAVDYEKLRIENQQQAEILRKRNEELPRLRLSAGRATQALRPLLPGQRQHHCVHACGQRHALPMFMRLMDQACRLALPCSSPACQSSCCMRLTQLCTK